jgi:hypothetical protein
MKEGSKEGMNVPDLGDWLEHSLGCLSSQLRQCVVKRLCLCMVPEKHCYAHRASVHQHMAHTSLMVSCTHAGTDTGWLNTYTPFSSVNLSSSATTTDRKSIQEMRTCTYLGRGLVMCVYVCVSVLDCAPLNFELLTSAPTLRLKSIHCSKDEPQPT